MHDADKTKEQLTAELRDVCQDLAPSRQNKVEAKTLNSTAKANQRDSNWVTIQLLNYLKRGVPAAEFLAEVVSLLAVWTGFDAVALRLQKGEDYPYFRTKGLSEEFIRLENSLCPQRYEGQGQPEENGKACLECACGRVLENRIDRSEPFFTDYGSFWTNSNTRLLSERPELRETLRGRCVQAGFETSALIPLRFGEQTFGLIQFEDKRTGRLSEELLSALEAIAVSVALALSHSQYAEQLQEAKDSLEQDMQETNRQLLEANAALQKSEDLFETTLENMMEGCQIISWDWKYLYLNDMAAKQSQRTREELIGRSMVECSPSIEDTELFSCLQHCMEKRVPHRMENEFTFPDGAKGWFALSIQPVPDGLFLLSIDISDRKKAEAEILRLNAELEQRVQERTAQLTAANQELESFAYAVSHDLRAPLRAMSGFSQALMEDYGTSLPGEARLYLEEITLASRHMGQLIDGLLTLSRNTRGILRHDRVNISALAERIRQELCQAEPERRVEWQIEPGLTARGDARMIGMVLRNLLENSWKYTCVKAMPVIRVYAEQDGGEQRFCVADNGAGFDMRHAGKLFQPFQRLHRQDEFSGIGIGLATVQRILHRHGGTIRAVATPGKGATFSFSLPYSGEPRRKES